MKPVRPLVERVAELVSKGAPGEVPRLVVEAPTGYGKSTGGPVFYRHVYERGFAESFIHVLPLRAIVRDLYVCTLLSSLAQRPPSLCGERSPPEDVRKALQDLGLSSSDVAYQMGELILGEDCHGEPYRKQPLFDAKYVVTTLDSFVYNLFRVPVTEILSTRKHYAIPRLRVFVSAVYLDEAHMVFEEGDEASTLYTSAAKAIEILATFKVPVVIASATLGERVIEKLRSLVGQNCKFVRLGLHDRESGHSIEVSDKDFVERIARVKWFTKLVSDSEVVERVKEHVNSGLRVLVVRDSVRKAIETYQELAKSMPRDSATLIHGLMTRGDRELALSRVKVSSKPGVVVATSVIEAGVDVSFDVLVTDGLRPRSVVQRAGRVCRYGECEEGTVQLVKEYSDRVLLEFVNSVLSKGYEICWRIPFDIPSHGYKGYAPLIDRLNEPLEDYKLGRLLEALVDPLFVSGRTINEVLETRDHALTRVGIVEAVVGGVEQVAHWNYGDLVSHGLVLPSRVVDALLEKGCIDGLISVHGENDVESVELVCKSNELVDKGHFTLRKYVECLREAYGRRDGNVLYTAILVKSECYKKGVGLVTWLA